MRRKWGENNELSERKGNVMIERCLFVNRMETYIVRNRGQGVEENSLGKWEDQINFYE